MERPVHSSREMTREETGWFLTKQLHGRLGLCAEGEPYVVPVAYGYIDGAIYFHGAKKGKKIDFIEKNDRVCFEVDEWRRGWASVICYGKVTLREDIEAKKKCFELLMGVDLPEDRIKGAIAYVGVIDIKEMTGRCSVDYEFR